MPTTGCVSGQITAALSGFPFCAAYCAGRISDEQYVAEVEAHAHEIEARAGSVHHVYALASRYPRSSVILAITARASTRPSRRASSPNSLTACRCGGWIAAP